MKTTIEKSDFKTLIYRIQINKKLILHKIK